MNPYPQQVATAVSTSTRVTNKLIRNTYTLLAMTLLFSAATAGMSMALNLPHPGLLITLAGYFGLLFLTYKSHRVRIVKASKRQQDLHAFSMLWVFTA